MKYTFAAIAILFATIAHAYEPAKVDGYTRKDGTYVQPHYRSAPDERRDNNWSSKGNSNPYTGERGTQDPYQQPQPYRGSMYDSPSR